MRLDRYISTATALSRSQAQREIRSGRVRVNAEVVRDPAHRVVSGDAVSLASLPVAPSGPRYFMLHKPAGYVCARHDALHPVVLDLLDEPGKDALHPVGRLDLDTTGLLLITDDGDWSHRVTSPRRSCPKTYRVTLAEPLPTDAIERLCAGVKLRGDSKPTLPADLTLLSDHECRLTIQEGRYHQVKRMMAAMGNRVVALHRESVGAIRLDDALAVGEYRSLTEAEVASVG